MELTSYFVNFDITEFHIKCMWEEVIFDPIEIFSNFSISGFWSGMLISFNYLKNREQVLNINYCLTFNMLEWTHKM